MAKSPSKHTIDLLRRMCASDPAGSIDNPRWHGWSGARVQRAAAIRAGWIQVYNPSVNGRCWSVSAAGRQVAGLAPAETLSDAEAFCNAATARPLGW